jgi:hypothetical protein
VKWIQVGYIFPEEGVKKSCDDCGSRRKLSNAGATEWGGASTSDCPEGAGPGFAELIEKPLNEPCKMKPPQQRHRVLQYITLTWKRSCYVFGIGADAEAERSLGLNFGVEGEGPEISLHTFGT